MYKYMCNYIADMTCEDWTVVPALTNHWSTPEWSLTACLEALNPTY